jgi:predicted dehydrogenase
MVAVCDPKRWLQEERAEMIDKAYGTTGTAMYTDFRELLARPDIDGVSISTNDHWHVLIALAAARAGKDMYVEKPLGVCLHENQVLRDVIQRTGRVFQFGTQQRSQHIMRYACELAVNGRIGKLERIETSAPPGGAGERFGAPTYEPQPVPEGFDYDLWLGPAVWAPYHEKRVVNPTWFHISDYSSGYIAGWGIHHIDIANWGNGTEFSGPLEIDGHAVYPSNDAMCDNALRWDVTMTYANGVVCRFVSDGGPHKHGTKFIGTEGWVHVDRGSLTASDPKILTSVIGPDEIHLTESKFQQQNLIDCMRSRARTVSPIEVAVRSDALCHLSNISMRLGRKIKWDPVNEKIVGDPDAERLVDRPRRGEWQL